MRLDLALLQSYRHHLLRDESYVVLAGFEHHFGVDLDGFGMVFGWFWGFWGVTSKEAPLLYK